VALANVQERAVFKGEVPTHVCEPLIIIVVVDDHTGNITWIDPSFLTVPTLVNLMVNLTEESSPMISELDVITGFTDIVLGVNPVMEIPETLANDGFDVVPTIAEMDESTVVE
jgi:hypothetical protein